MALLPIAEKLASLVEKVKSGQEIPRDDLQGIKAINGQILFGYS